MPAYSERDVAELIAKTVQEREALLVTALRLTEEEAACVPQNAQGEEQWTAKEQLAHLLEMDHGYIAACRRALADPAHTDAQAGPADPPAIPIEDAARHSVAELVAALRARREFTLGFLRALPLEAFAQPIRTRGFGELTVMQWLRSFYRHDRQHHAQILGRQSDYQPRFAGGGPEMNQRRMRIAQTQQRQAQQ